MKWLLDTCTLLWWVADDAKVPASVLRKLAHEDTELYLSAGSAWEIAIKSKLGKLELPASPRAFMHEVVDLYALTVLPIELEDAVHAGELPFHHKDPFDRLIIAQSRLRKLDIVTPDDAFRPYKVSTVWR
jgi:PIN domain nuclease of toxin-antitoxin system